MKRGTVWRIAGDRRQFIQVDGGPYPDRNYPDSGLAGGRRLGQSGGQVGGSVLGENHSQASRLRVTDSSSSGVVGEHADAAQTKSGCEIGFVSAVRKLS